MKTIAMRMSFIIQMLLTIVKNSEFVGETQPRTQGIISAPPPPTSRDNTLGTRLGETLGKL